VWDQAYLEQSRSDWEAYKVLHESTLVKCHELHYLQMTTEKLAKAILARGGTSPTDLKKSHKAFLRFLRQSRRHPGLRQVLNMNNSQLERAINEALSIAYEIEKLTPSVEPSGSNCEYPWEDGTGKVCVPASYSFPVSNDLNSLKGRRLLGLIQVILERFDEIF
jgi:hypothetical protein